jgi:thiamine monophosphate synthase
MRLLAITPPAALAPTLDPGVVEQWLAAGAGALGLAVLLREPGATAERIVAAPRLLALRRTLADQQVPAFLSVDPDRCGLGLELEHFADWLRAAEPAIAGIQLRGDPSPELCERWRVALPTMTIGRSVHGLTPTPNRFVDYTCLAPIYPPTTPQPGVEKHAIGLEGLRKWTAVSDTVIALGGITAVNTGACLAAGARGIAGIRLFFGGSAAARENVEALRQVFSLRESPGTEADDHGSQTQRRG